MGNDNVASDLATAYDERLNSVAPNAIWIQLGLMGGTGLAAVLLFSILRPNNSVIYQPKVKYSEDGHRPPKISKGMFSWVHPLLTTGEDALLETIGLDAVTYLRFLRMCRDMFAVLAALACTALIPVDVIYNLKNNVTSRTYITMLTIQDVNGNWLWAHVAVTYLATLIVFFFVWINYAAMVRLRWQWFRSPEYQNSLHSRSLLITQVSKANKSDPGIANLLSSLQIPYPTTAIHIGRRVGELPALIEAHNDTVRALEGVLTRYFKDPNRLPTKRPTMRIGGSMGCGGEKVDAIDHLTEKIKRYDQRIEMARAMIGEKKPENYGFASFESVPYAHVVAKRLEGKRKNGAKFQLAPTPKDIIWSNLSLLDSQRRSNKFFGAILLVVFCFFYTIPLLAVSILANITALSGYVQFIKDWATNYKFLMSAFVGVVPPLLSVILQLLLPAVLRWIAKGQGATTHSQSDRLLTARYSAFLLITQFFIFSVIGVIVGVVSKVVTTIQDTDGATTTRKILDEIKSIPGLFQSTWLIQSSYWLTVFPLRGASALFDLAQVVALLLVWVRTRLFGRTPREIREWTKPPEFDYAVYFSNHILMVAVGFVYAPLAPLVPLFAAAAFGVSSLVYKYQLMYVCVSRVETGGRLWRVVINRLLFGLLMMHALMLLTIGLQTGWMNSISLAPPMAMVIIYKIILTKKFDDQFRWFIPSEHEMHEVYLHQADARKNRLQKRFGHPSLNDTLFTPMLHKGVQHLLPTIYTGRIGQGQGDINGKAVEQNTAGGLTFNILEAHDLAYDRNEYLRQRDEDAATVSTAAAFAGTETQGPADGDYFAARRAEYLKYGASTPGLETPDDLPYELSRMPTQMSTASSQENLIQYGYPPTYASPPAQRAGPQGRHQPTLSQQSFDTGYYGGQDMELVDQYTQQSPPLGALPPRSDSRGSNPSMAYPPMGQPSRPDSWGASPSMNYQPPVRAGPRSSIGGYQQGTQPSDSRGYQEDAPSFNNNFRPPHASRLSREDLSEFAPLPVDDESPATEARRGYQLEDRPVYSRMDSGDRDAT